MTVARWVPPLFGIRLFPKHDLFRKPVSTFRGHALEQFQPRRQRQAAGQFAHFFFHRALGLGAGIGVSRRNQILDDFLFRGLQQARVDRNVFQRALGAEDDGDKPAASRAGVLGRLELRLHLLHAALQLLHLAHHAHEVGHHGSPRSSESRSSIAPSPVSVSLAASSRRRTSTISAPGKRSSTAFTKGSERTSCASATFFAAALSASVGAPSESEIATNQRLPVHSVSLVESSLVMPAGTPDASAISRRPSWMRTSRS